MLNGCGFAEPTLPEGIPLVFLTAVQRAHVAEGVHPADGAVRTIPYAAEGSVVWALLTPDGKETVSPSDY